MYQQVCITSVYYIEVVLLMCEHVSCHKMQRKVTTMTQQTEYDELSSIESAVWVVILKELNIQNQISLAYSFNCSAKASLLPASVRNQLTTVISTAIADARTRIGSLTDDAVAVICSLPTRRLRQLALMVRLDMNWNNLALIKNKL